MTSTSAPEPDPDTERRVARNRQLAAERSPADVEQANRLNLRGWTWDAIATQCGYPSGDAARAHVRNYRDKHALSIDREHRLEVFESEDILLARMAVALVAQVTEPEQPDLRAVAPALKTLQQRRDLNAVTADFVTDNAARAQLVRRAEQVSGSTARLAAAPAGETSARSGPKPKPARLSGGARKKLAAQRREAQQDAPPTPITPAITATAPAPARASNRDPGPEPELSAGPDRTD